jgi:yecA family protein
MPPDLVASGALPFGEAERARLTAWLREGGWPRGQMEIAELEGFLVALIAWPVGISSGAWLPRIWGESGWKVAAKIATRSQYDEFIALIIGFMQDLDRQLSAPTSRFESSVLRELQGTEQAAALHVWGRGFMTALTLGSQGLKWRSVSAGDAVTSIANLTSAASTFNARVTEEVVTAVLSLMAQRPSRGPLGALEGVVSRRSSGRPVD